MFQFLDNLVRFSMGVQPLNEGETVKDLLQTISYNLVHGYDATTDSNLSDEERQFVVAMAELGL